MKYLLDTCVVSDYIKGHGDTKINLLSHDPGDIALSSITVFEINYGLERNAAVSLKIKPMLQAFIDNITVIPFTASMALRAGGIRAYLQQKGTPIGSYDILIAATAVVEDLILVTANTGEFSRIPGIQLESWR